MSSTQKIAHDFAKSDQTINDSSGLGQGNFFGDERDAPFVRLRKLSSITQRELCYCSNRSSNAGTFSLVMAMWCKRKNLFSTTVGSLIAWKPIALIQLAPMSQIWPWRMCKQKTCRDFVSSTLSVLSDSRHHNRRTVRERDDQNKNNTNTCGCFGESTFTRSAAEEIISPLRDLLNTICALFSLRWHGHALELQLRSMAMQIVFLALVVVFVTLCCIKPEHFFTHFVRHCALAEFSGDRRRATMWIGIK